MAQENCIESQKCFVLNSSVDYECLFVKTDQTVNLRSKHSIYANYTSILKECVETQEYIHGIWYV